MKPDTPLVSEVLASPNFGGRTNAAAKMLILHYTGLPTAQEAIDMLRTPGSGVSCHYVVREDGAIVQMVPEALRAWQAGPGSWHGRSDINSRSIGIEIVNHGHAGDLPPYPEAQIDAVIALCRDIMRRRRIPRERVLAHSDIAPMRKPDPGEHFPWGRLASEGVGHWVAPAPLSTEGPGFAYADRGPAVQVLQALFAYYGYEQPLSGVVDPQMFSVVVAFQRHFRQERVDGNIDASTIATLKSLVDALRTRG